jgi:hypothetical protein
VYNVAAEQYGLDPVDIKTIYETIKAKKNTGRYELTQQHKIAGEFDDLEDISKKVLELFNTIDESISKIEQEDANVVKPTVTTGSKSGTPATEPGVGDGIGLDAAQGAAKLETPAAPGLGAAVSDTSTDNVPEGSQSAALRALIEEMRAATSGDINAAIPKSLAKRALDAGLIKKEDMGMALIARVAMKDAVDAYDAQPAPEQTTAAPIP